MNCLQVSEILLKGTDLRNPDPVVQEHLGGCAECGKLAARLCAMENELVAFCKPASQGTLNNLEGKVLAKLGPFPVKAPAILRFRKPNMDRARQKLALAVALVAILFTVAMGLFILPPTVDRDSLPGLVAQKDYQLSRARSLPVRIQMVTDMVRQGRTETRLLSQQGDTRRVLLHTTLLVALMEKDVENLIASVGGDLRERKSDLAQELAYLESDCQRLAIQHASREDVSSALLKLAVVSKRAETRLRLDLAS